MIFKLNPHLHIIATDGCFYDQDDFMVGPQPDPKALEQDFRLEGDSPNEDDYSQLPSEEFC